MTDHTPVPPRPHATFRQFLAQIGMMIQVGCIAILCMLAIEALLPWYYCAEHLYGREIRDGVVMVQVLVDVPHA